MIRIEVWRAADGVPVQLRVTGHARSKIVCAAASALVETLVMGLQQVCQQASQATVRDGNAEIRLPRTVSAQAQAVVETILLGLKDLARTEPTMVSWQEIREG